MNIHLLLVSRLSSEEKIAGLRRRFVLHKKGQRVCLETEVGFCIYARVQQGPCFRASDEQAWQRI